MSKAKCYNCKHASEQFKVLKLTHLHCLKPEHHDLAEKGEISPWDTLRVFSDTCEDHEIKTPKQ